MTFKAATYNVLATAHLGNGDYSAVDPDLLDPTRRASALVRHVAGLDADLLCLQEVEAEVFLALKDTLAPLGYAGHLELKGRGKPDGCASLFRTGVFSLRKALRLDYLDREKGPDSHSGHVALLLSLEHQGRLLGVANTHLRWDRAGTAKKKQVGHRQALELLDACRTFAPPCDGWIVCGDFNRRPDSEVVATFRQAGFEYAHAGRPHVRSAVANRHASLLDYLFHSPELRARPIDPPPVSDRTVLPTAEQPSDHLAVRAEFEWVEEAALSGSVVDLRCR
jgi:mRNA deadenylase 3'-5' endonuclease subunit Ccr4